jgi:high-affinity iron transporter
MLQAFVVTLREGIEAFLIVAISLAYLRKTGRDVLRAPVYWAIVVSLLTSAVAGYFFSLALNQAFWEGLLALVAAVLVATLVIHMLRVGRTLQQRIQSRLNTAASSTSSRTAWLAVFLFVVLMITREGMEAALLLGTLLFQTRALEVAAGALGGLVAAAGIALLWGRYGHRVNLRRFLQVTAMFLLLFVGQLIIYGIHELSEANVLPASQAIHDATEPYGPDGIYGRWVSLGLVVLPLGFLGVSTLAERARRSRPSPPIQRPASA